MIELDDLHIRQFKLMNGDEIIGLVANHNETNFIIDRPFKVEVNQHKHDAYQLVPWFDLSLSNTFTIERSMVVAHADVANNIKRAYIKFALDFEEKTQDMTDIDNGIEDEPEIPTLIPDKPDTVH